MSTTSCVVTQTIEKDKQLIQQGIHTLANSKTVNVHVVRENPELILVKVYHQDKPAYFLLNQRLGAGTFGEVFKARCLDADTGDVIPEAVYAVKITDYSQGGTLGVIDRESALTEAQDEHHLLEELHCSFGFSKGTRKKTVTYQDEDIGTLTYEAQVEEAILVMLLYPGHDIKHDKHRHRFSFGSLTTLHLGATIAAQLAELHGRNILHTDLKPDNIIWDAKEGHTHIIDFNRAKRLPHGDTHILVSYGSDRGYMAPETETDNGYLFSRASDIFSFGKIMVQQFMMVDNRGESHSLHNKPYLSYDELLLAEFLNRMCHSEEDKRPNAKACQRFFRELVDKIKLDIKKPNDPLRLHLSRQLIRLETYANELWQTIQHENMASHALYQLRLIDDRAARYQEVLNAIRMVVSALSQHPVNIAALKTSDELAIKDKTFNSLWTSKSQFQTLLEDIKIESGKRLTMSSLSN
ncbi:protein kinase domain-containing protein [Legionella erythra]|uniref:Serine/threonine-protein kinase C n=1 Tax=Legionella erythra TaxID=448 RepID=A0A0W0TPJ6_LEGER|nr:protein kinase [Legionella erythra]KTC97518.1 Serine/threonine-protein kinase C [Legionella erythra]